MKVKFLRDIPPYKLAKKGNVVHLYDGDLCGMSVERVIELGIVMPVYENPIRNLYEYVRKAYVNH